MFFIFPYYPSLELKQVGSVSLLEEKAALQILLQQRNLLDGSSDSGVDGLSINVLCLSLLLSGLLSLEEISLGLLGSLDDGGLEQTIIELLGLDAREVNLGGGGDHRALGDTGEGDSVELAGTSDKEHSRSGELLNKDDTATSMDTAQQDEDGSRGDGGT